jgi:hypothetical protein
MLLHTCIRRYQRVETGMLSHVCTLDLESTTDSYILQTQAEEVLYTQSRNTTEVEDHSAAQDLAARFSLYASSRATFCRHATSGLQYNRHGLPAYSTIQNVYVTITI